jgi:hypothetical protein
MVNMQSQNNFCCTTGGIIGARRSDLKLLQLALFSLLAESDPFGAGRFSFSFTHMKFRRKCTRLTISTIALLIPKSM